MLQGHRGIRLALLCRNENPPPSKRGKESRKEGDEA